MSWRLRDPRFRQAIQSLLDAMNGRGVLAGTVGVQVHLAAAIGLDKRGPPAHGIDIVSLSGDLLPERIGDVRVTRVDTLGFENSIAARTKLVEIDGQQFPVAAPEHILGMQLAAPELHVDAKWASFVLMRQFCDDLDLEEVRGFLKRSPVPDRQELLAELAYLAA